MRQGLSPAAFLFAQNKEAGLWFGDSCQPDVAVRHAIGERDELSDQYVPAETLPRLHAYCPTTSSSPGNAVPPGSPMVELAVICLPSPS